MQTINIRLLAIKTFGRVLRWRRHARHAIYYINGPDVLPRPLSRDEEAGAVAALESGGNEAEEARTAVSAASLGGIGSAIREDGEQRFPPPHSVFSSWKSPPSA